ncbi:B12-binding domain-containing radical SAM protein [Patescibacteria group bacterium]
MLKSLNKNGHVLLISRNITYIFPSGYGYLAGYLKEKGENVKILLRPDDPSQYYNFVKKILLLKPLLVGFGTIYPDLYPTKKIIKLLNEFGRDFPIVIGGQMVSPTPEFSVEVTGADIGVIGEGEIILYNLVKTLREGSDVEKVKGLVINKGTEKILTGQGEFIQDLSKLPKIPYELFPSTEWLNVGRLYLNVPQPHNQYNDRTVTIHGGRGCPFNCNFCYHHSIPRYRSIDSMIKEAGELIKKFNANLLYFDDDLAICSPHRARELAEKIGKLHKRVEYSVSGRFDILEQISDNTLMAMKKSGLRCMNIGVESGSQKILDVIHKKITVEQILKGIERLGKIGILPNANIMVGQLSETNEDVQKSMDLMIEALRINKNMNWSFSITTPFPGSELYDVCFKKGIFKTHYDFFKKFDENKIFNEVIANLTEMKDEEILNWLQKLRITFKLERRKLIGKHVYKIENLRARADRLNKRINKKIFERLANDIVSNIIKKIYTFFYNLMQVSFDKIRLKLLGVKKY